MVALFIADLEVPNKRLISSVVLIGMGTAIASYGEINLSVLGVTFMLLSESFEATRLVMTQILLVGLKFHPSECSFSFYEPFSRRPDALEWYNPCNKLINNSCQISHMSQTAQHLQTRLS